jgi:tetratricopeptide (TPR) repeat protein
LRRLLACLVLASGIGTVSAQVPASEQDRRDAYVHYQRGQEFLSAERWEQAATEFTASIKLDQLFTDAHYGLGRAYMGMERYASAVRAYEGCLQAARAIYGLRERDRAAGDQQIIDQIRALREAIITVRKQQTGQIENQVLQIEARIRELERSRSSLSGPYEPPPEVLLALGSAHFRNGNPEQAQQNWEAAVATNPKLGEAWNNLAVVYMRAGRKADAERAVKNAEAAGFRVHPQLKQDIRAMKV